MKGRGLGSWTMIEYFTGWRLALGRGQVNWGNKATKGHYTSHMRCSVRFCTLPQEKRNSLTCSLFSPINSIIVTPPPIPLKLQAFIAPSPPSCCQMSRKYLQSPVLSLLEPKCLLNQLLDARLSGMYIRYSDNDSCLESLLAAR